MKHGIEIEFYGVSALLASRTVRDTLGGDIGRYPFRLWHGAMVERLGVKHLDGRVTWNHKDPSVPGEGLELISPILESGMDTNRWLTIGDALKAIGAKTETVNNATCGLHVHTSDNDLSPVAAAMLVRSWWRHEDYLIRGLAVEPARLAKYTKPLQRGGNATRIWAEKPETAQELAESWFGSEGNLAERLQDHYDGARYYTLNLCPYWTHGTVEARLFNGTVDSAAIAAYVAFMAGFIGQAIADSAGKKTSAVKKPLSGDNKADKATLLALLGKLKVSKEHHKHLALGFD